MSVKVTSYKNQVMAKLAGAFAKTAQAYDANLHLVIRLKRNWAEPPGFGVTRRRNKTIVIGNFRNIYDLGNLDKSQRMTFLSPFRVRFSWDGLGITPPVVIHEGATLKNGRRIPSRKFTRVAAKETEFEKVFSQAFNT